MKIKHQNIGQWRATLYLEQNSYTLKIAAVIPTTENAASCRLICMEEFSSAEFGLVYRLEGTKYLNVESEGQTYLVSRSSKEGECPYSKVIIIGFRPGENHSFLIAISAIENGLTDF